MVVGDLSETGFAEALRAEARFLWVEGAIRGGQVGR